jgi:hypothetical protein
MFCWGRLGSVAACGCCAVARRLAGGHPESRRASRRMLPHQEASFRRVLGVLFEEIRHTVARRFVGRSTYGDDCQQTKVCDARFGGSPLFDIDPEKEGADMRVLRQASSRVFSELAIPAGGCYARD